MYFPVANPRNDNAENSCGDNADIADETPAVGNDEEEGTSTAHPSVDVTSDNLVGPNDSEDDALSPAALPTASSLLRSVEIVLQEENSPSSPSQLQSADNQSRPTLLVAEEEIPTATPVLERTTSRADLAEDKYNFWSFINGAIDWDPFKIYDPSERDMRKIQESLEDEDVDGLLASYMSWRKKTLMYVFPFLLITFVIGIQQFAEKVQTGLIFEHEGTDQQLAYNGLGLVALLSRDIFPTLIWFSGCALSLFTWHDLKVSLTIMYFSGLLALLCFLWPLAIQGQSFVGSWEERVDTSSADNNSTIVIPAYVRDVAFSALITANSLQNIVLDILPILLGFPRGLTSAALNVFGFVEGSVSK